MVSKLNHQLKTKMTSARKAALLRFILWILLSFLIRSQNPGPAIAEVITIMALIEGLIASSPLLDAKVVDSKKYENPLDKK